MFIFSTKLTKTKILTISLVGACLALLLLISIPSGIRASKNVVKGETNEERIEYLETFGWEVSTTPVEVVSIVIPEKFDQTYTEYNALQISQGFDLNNYKGDAGTRYTYSISNYPSNTGAEVLANVIVIDNKIVAADVSSVSAGGFMHTLQMPENTANNSTNTNTDTAGPNSGSTGMTTDEMLDNLGNGAK